MELTWLGHSCFRLRGKEVTVITDPFGPQLGYTLGRISAQIVTISHDHPGHNNVAAVGGDPYVLRGPGEYEVQDVLVTAVASYHDAERGKRLGRNTIYLMHIDDLAVCHLGDLGHLLTDQQREEMSDVDILLVPVGGKNTINAAQAAEVISQIDPRIVIPMHYATPATEGKVEGLDPLEKFCREMGVEAAEPQPKLAVTRSSLPAEPQVITLNYRG
ncbi:MAG TPA: MBL fold metallo-hydrolase [Ktedonobacterales bacterium]|jgi:L-ascorbate metabolism protein UlaG (beta-lactamase superfamily)